VDEESEEYKQKVAQIEKLSRKLVRLARRIKAVQEADLDCEEMDKWGNLYLQVNSIDTACELITLRLITLQVSYTHISYQETWVLPRPS
jgi:hypothetical protein